ncbi:tyrosine-type recombinase/integrase [Rhizobium sp. NFR03]|uniref:tyrosine-type recombinase/integrase n=1 Tax=Rhizobium sp. NFR03 TaxID=1566263 RepID=UPI0008C67299|nr:tyrosine-type recombinase/integrase [Rhizobium sp. NFR03]SER58543.1 Site-specific recombinase XerD [Rhizobium sp. NFR03]
MNDLMPRKLPLYVCKQKDRNGAWVYYFRIGKGSRTRLPDPNNARFRAAYQAALAGTDIEIRDRDAPNTIAWLIARYMESAEWAGLQPATRKQRSNIFFHVKEKSDGRGGKIGMKSYSLITEKAVRAGMEDRGKTPAAANNYLKSMSALCKWAVKNGHMKSNPAEGADRYKLKGDGFPAWEIEDVRAFCIKWPIGTKQRLAMELAMHTGLRRSDLVRIGRQHLRGSALSITTAKTSARITVELPQRVIDIIAATQTGDLHFLVTDYGKPFSVPGFGNWFGEASRKAGLEKNTHGLRKLAATMAANGGATAHELMSQFGWSNSKQAEIYTKKADRARLGVKASRIVSEQLENELAPHSETCEGKIPNSVTNSSTKN